MSTPLPPRSTPAVPTVGIDAGATLCKLALWDEGLQTAVFPSNELGPARDWVRQHAPARIVATGGAAARLGSSLGGVPIRCVSEFDAWASGARVLASRQGLNLPERYLVISLGTGTFVLAVQPAGATRAGGCALGGGTLMGLGRLLTGVDSFQGITALAAQGDRRRVDLLVGDVYSEGAPPLAAAVTAASYGKLASTRAEDLAHALVGMVGENVGLICAGLARIHDAPLALYGGSTLVGNPLLQRILAGVGMAMGIECRVLADAAFCGAVGATTLGAD